MKQALIDTSFILSCVKQKIDFFSYLEREGFRILIPEAVIVELKKLSKSSSYARTALRLLEKNKYEEVIMKEKTADKTIVQIAKEIPSIVVASLDNGIKRKIKNKKLVIRGKKKLAIF